MPALEAGGCVPVPVDEPHTSCPNEAWNCALTQLHAWVESHLPLMQAAA